MTVLRAISRSLMFRFCEALVRIANAASASQRFCAMITPIAWSIIDRLSMAFRICSTSVVAYVKAMAFPTATATCPASSSAISTASVENAEGARE